MVLRPVPAFNFALQPAIMQGMNRSVPVIVLLTVLCLPAGLQNQGHSQEFTLAHARPQSMSLDTDQVIDPSSVDEDDFFYDPEIISRKLFQKTLPALSGRQKILWSFRMADSDLFQ